MCKHCINCSSTFSIVLVAGTNNYALPSGDVVNGKDLTAVGIRRQNANGTAKDKSGRTLAADNVLATAHFTIKTQGNKALPERLPVDYIAFDSDAGVTCVNWKQVDLNSSELTLDSTVSGFVAGNVIEITCFYNCNQNC